MARRFRRLLKWLAIAALLVFTLAFAAVAIAYVRSDNDCGGENVAHTNPMRAVRYCEYGSADVLSLAAIERPLPAADQLLVRVHAASVNPLDVHYLHGTPYLMRLSAGLRVPKVTRLGVDFAGTVVAVGSKVTKFKPGDAVFGGRTGAFAEYVVVREQSVAAKPPSISFEQAAAIPVAGVTALQALRDHAKVRAGERVLINGASGGVGTFAVQIAKSFGAHVTGVSSTPNVALVRSLGAGAVIDYKREDFTNGHVQYDAIVDMVGNHPIGAYRRVLKPGGRYVAVGGQKGRWLAPVDRAVALAVVDRFTDQELGSMLSKLNRDDLVLLATLVATGRVTPVIDRRYPLTQIAEALRYLETGRARGKVIVTMPPQRPVATGVP